MFLEPTVFVLGAGASWHYGYPTGYGLIDLSLEFSDQINRYCDVILKNNAMWAAPKYIVERNRVHTNGAANGIRYDLISLRDLTRRYRDYLTTINPVVIDYFLGQNESIREIGQFIIAGVILEREARWYANNKCNVNHVDILLSSPDRHAREAAKRVDVSKFSDKWHRFVVHKLMYGCNTSKDLLANKVNFVSFNYDQSLEKSLYDSLIRYENFDKNHVVEFIKRSVIHVYGDLGDDITGNAPSFPYAVYQNFADFPNLKDADDIGACAEMLNNAYLKSLNIKTIDGVNKSIDNKFNDIKQIMLSASNIYILGYGFDNKNNERIGLSSLKSYYNSSGFNKKIRIMLSNFRNLSSINKRISLLFDSNELLFENRPHYIPPGRNIIIEKSHDNVYDSLADIFYVHSEEGGKLD